MSHGFELGANLMNSDFMIDEEGIETNNAWGPRVGYVGEYYSGSLYFRISGLYMQKGFKFEEEIWAVNSFDIPLILGYLFDINGDKLQLFFEGGLSLEYNFRAITRIEDNPVELSIGNNEGEIKSFTTGVTFGTGIRLNQLIKFRINYYNGVSNMVNTEGTDSWKNHYLGFSLDFFFKKMKS